MANPIDTSISRVIESGERVMWTGEPTAGGLFRANLSAMIDGLFFAAICVGGFVGTIVTHGPPYLFAVCGALGLFALYSLRGDVRRAFAARHLHYAITNRRILVIDDRDATPIAFARRRPEGESDARWYQGNVRCNSRPGGRATIRFDFEAYSLGGMHTGPRYRTFTQKLVAVADSDRAVAILKRGEGLPSHGRHG